MKNLKFVFVFALLMGATNISYAQCMTYMNIDMQPREGYENQVVCRVDVEFDDSGSNYMLIYKDRLNSPSKQCDESPCSQWFVYVKAQHDTYKEITCHVPQCSAPIGCIVVVEGLHEQEGQ